MNTINSKGRSRKWILIFLSVICFPLYNVTAQHTHADGSSHDDHDHGSAEPAAKEIKMRKSEAVSERYELVLKYEHLHANEAGKLTLYIADATTNRAVSGAKIALSTSLDSKATFTVKPQKAGVYEITSMFTKERIFALTIKIEGINGPDLMMLKGVLVGHDESEHNHENEVTRAAWFKNPYVLVFGGLLAGMVLMFLLIRVRNKKLMSVLLIAGSVLPTAQYQPSFAQHEGHSHGDEGGKSPANLSNEFEVPKETQFLFDILTQPLNEGTFNETSQLYGTVVPSSTGQALVQTPQTGRLVTLNTKVGQRVRKGQTLATLEQTLDATAQVSLQTERNSLDAEMIAARKEYDRLKTIEDIAAKRDLNEAEARLRKAEENLKVFNSIAKGSKGNTRMVALTAPISGVIAPFGVAIGSIVGVGETIFTITDLSTVYIEAQAFGGDAELVKAESKLELISTADGTQKRSNRIHLLSSAQAVNANQSQKLLFELNNADGAFKIGEFVTVRLQTAQTGNTLSLPNAALSQISGKPVVFVKEGPETFRIAYVATGINNGDRTTIIKGLETDEKVVINSAYQLKMMFMNQ